MKSVDMTDFEPVQADTDASQVSKTQPCAVQDTVQGSAMHSKEVQGYSIKDLMTELGSAKRTVFKYAGQLIDVWFWLDETEFRASGTYTPFALQEMLKLKEMGVNSYRELIHDSNVEQFPFVEPEVVEVQASDNQWASSEALAIYNQSQQSTSTLASYDYTKTSYLSVGEQRLANSNNRLAQVQTQSFDLSNRLLTQLSALSQDKQLQEVANQQDIAADIDNYAIQQAHIQLAKILKGEEMARTVEAMYRNGVSPEEIAKVLQNFQTANIQKNQNG